ncbi:MAG: hypothetical protein PSX80_04780 [bacterium]|nr:hypothetical protein [bacterium]
MASETIGWKEWLTFLSPAGQEQIIDFIRQAREERGGNWLPEIKAEFPMFAFIVELIADREADQAFEELQSQFSGYPLWMVKDKLISLHGRMRAEIDRPRG